MTHTAALDILQLPESANHAEIEARYRERFNTIQQQLRNAPDHLKVTFQRNLSEVEQAYSVLLSDNTALLPSEKPVEVAVNPKSDSQNPTSDTPSVSAPILNKPDAARFEKLKKQQTYWLATVIGLAAILSFFAVQWFEKKNALDKAEPKAMRMDKLEKEWLNRKFSIRNGGSKPFKVLHYLVCYLNEDGVLKELEDNTEEVVEPNRTFSIQKTEGKKQVFDGKGIFYTVIVIPVNQSNAVPVSFSGLLKSEGDTPINAD